jgi:CRISPR-associated protein Cas1
LERSGARLVPADWEFPGRRGRGARDPMNSVLNYGYALLMHQVWWAIERQGLHPYLGFLHTSRRERPELRAARDDGDEVED